jgi:cyanophycin synthetase
VASQPINDLARRAAARPEDGAAAFDYASALDGADREAEAIPVYQRALRCGLPDELEYQAFVQLGSSLRVVGRANEAVAVHREASARWPDRVANRLFLALALLDAEGGAMAVREVLLGVLASDADPDIGFYRRALTAYAQQLGRRD